MMTQKRLGKKHKYLTVCDCSRQCRGHAKKKNINLRHIVLIILHSIFFCFKLKKIENVVNASTRDNCPIVFHRK